MELRSKSYTDVCVEAPGAYRLFQACLAVAIAISACYGDPGGCPHFTIVDDRYDTVGATQRSKGFLSRAYASTQEYVTPLSLLFGMQSPMLAMSRGLDP